MQSSCLDTERIAACAGDVRSQGFPDDVLSHIEDCASCRAAVAAVMLADAAAADGDSPAAFIGPWLAQDEVARRYRLERVLGAGGMGIVCLATDRRLDRPVALKVLRPPSLLRCHARTERLQHESKMMARLRHPNVITVFDVGEHAGHTYVAMEYLAGGTLRAWLQATPRRPDEILAMYAMAGRGLAAAHAVGVVHGDFKPDNALVGEDGRVQVGDFGLARELSTMVNALDTDARASGATASVIGGTPAYMAPEQYDGGLVDARTDVFAFSVALWEALSGTLPFPGGTAREIRAAMADDPIWPRGGAAVPVAIRRSLAWGLARDAGRRPASMDELLTALQAGARAPRWPWLAGGAAAVALVLAIGMGERGCPQLVQADARWTERRAVLSTALAERPELGPVATALLEQGDRYHADWRTRLAGWCELGDGDTTPDDRAAIHRCLQDADVELAAVLETATATPAAAEQALSGLDGLPDVAACRERDDQSTPRPGDPVLAAEVDELRDGLARAGALARVGDLGAAATLLRELEARNVAAEFAPARAELALALAENEADGSAPMPARDRLRAVVEQAIAAGHESVAIRAWIDLGELVGELGGEPERGREYLGYANAALERLGRPARLACLVALARGRLLERTGQLAEARAALVQAAGSTCTEAGPEMDAMATLANIDGAMGDIEGALAVHFDLLERRRERYGDGSLPVARSHLAIGSAYGRLLRWDQSEAHARIAAELIAARLGPTHLWLAYPLHNRADALRRLGRYDAALEVERRALAVVEPVLGPGSDLQTRLHQGEAGILFDRGDRAQGQAILAQVCDDIERLRGGDLGLADCLVDLAAMRLEAHDPTAGLDPIARAVALYDRLTGPEADAMGRARSIQGRLLLAAGRDDAAVVELTAALAIFAGKDVGEDWIRDTQAALAAARP